MFFQKPKRCFVPFLLVPILSGCIPSVHIEKRPVVTENCSAEVFKSLLWKPAHALGSVSLPKGTRIIYPGQAVTMDYREDRLNIKIGKLDRIEQVFCG
jgi:hypothetical protein